MSDAPSNSDQATFIGPAAAPLAALSFRRDWECGIRPDVGEFLTSKGDLPASEVVAVLRVDQELRWQTGERPTVAEYLGRFSTISKNPEHLWNLVQNEFLIRSELGEEPSVSQYVEEFPQLRDRLRSLLKPSNGHAAFKLSNSPNSLLNSSFMTVGFLSPAGPDSMPVVHDSAFGSLVVPGYEIVEEVGRGSMGVIFKARSLRLKRNVALKMVVAGELSRPEHLARFRSEAETVAKLQHPNIVQIFEVGEISGRPFLVLEYLDGGTLGAHLQGKPIAARDAAQLTLTLSEAMAHAHAQGIVHRDLKPGNVLLTHAPVSGPHSSSTLTHSLSWSGATPQRTGPPFVPKIADFGLAKCIEEVSTQTQTGEILGTPSYMSPEQASGNIHTIGPPADVHALGAMLYEMLTGRPPFQGATPLDTVLLVKTEEPVPPTRLQPRLPGDLETICLKCLQKEPARRYSDAGELAMDIQRFLSGDPIHARPTGPLERTVKWMARRPAFATLLIVSLLGSVAFVANTLFYNRQLEGALKSEAFERHRAEDKERLATASAVREAAASKEANRQLVRLLLANGVRNLDEGDLSSSLVWFSEALQSELTTFKDADDRDRQRFKMHRIRLASLLQQCPRLVQYWLHNGSPEFARFSRDGSKAIVVDSNQTIHVNDSRTGLPMHSPLRIPNIDRIADVNFDGTLAVVLARKFRTLQLYHLETGKQQGPDISPPGPTEAAVFSPDGKSIALGTFVGLAMLDLRSMRISIADAEKHRFNEVAYSEDGSRLSAEHEGHAVSVFDSATLKLVGKSIPIDANRPVGTFSSDQKMFACTQTNTDVVLWNVAAGRSEFKHLSHDSPVTTMAFSPDGLRLAVGCRDGAIVLWSARHRRYLQTLRHRGRVTSLAYSPDASMLLSSSADQTTMVWDCQTGKPAASPLRHGGASVLGAEFAPDGRRILTHASDGSVRLWDLAAAVPVQSFVHRGATLQSANFGPKGRRILTVAADGSASVFDRDGQGKKLFDIPNESKVTRAAFNPAGTRIAALGDDGRIRVFHADSGTPISTPIFVNNNPIQNFSWDRTGQNLAFQIPYGFNVYSMRELRDVARVGNIVPCSSIVFTPDGGRVLCLAVRWGTTLRCYPVSGLPEADAAADGIKFEVQSPVDVVSIATSEAAGLFALSFQDGRVRLYNLATGKSEGADRIRHGSQVGVLAFSKDGTKIATGSDDGAAMIWDVKTGAATTPALTHSSGVRQIQFNTNGSYLLTLSEDRVARIWDVDSGLPITPAMEPGEAMSAEFSPAGDEILIASVKGIAKVYRLESAGRAIDELSGLSRLLSGLRRENSLGLSPISASEIEALWRRLRQVYPNYSQVTIGEAAAWHRSQAEDLEAEKFWSGAVFHLRQLIEIEPKSLALKLRLSENLQRLERFGDALRVMNGLVLEVPDDASLLRRRAFLHARMNANALAIADLDRTLKAPAGANHTVDWMATAGVSLLMQDQRRAGESFELAWTTYFEPRLRQSPFQDEIASGNSAAWRSLVEDFFNFHLQTRPTDGGLLRLRGAAYWTMGRWDLAADDLRKSAGVLMADAKTWTLLATALRNLRRNNEALTACQSALRIADKSALLWRLKGELLISLRPLQYAEAVAAFQFATKLDPNSNDWQQIAVLHQAQGNTVQAIEAFANAVRGKPPRFDLCYHLALLQLSVGRVDDYRLTCEELLRAARDPSIELDRNTVGWIVCLSPACVKDMSEVVAMIEKVVAQSEDKFASMNTLGAAYLRAGKPQLAINTVRKAISMHTNDASAWDWYLIAIAEAKLGRLDEAKSNLGLADSWIDRAKSGKIKSASTENVDSWENRTELRLLRGETLEAIARLKAKQAPSATK